MMNLSDKTIRKIQKHRKQPQYGKLLQIMESFSVVLFTDQIYMIGRGGFGRCYLGKICTEKGQEIQQNLNKSIINILDGKNADKNIVVVKIIPRNKKKSNEELYSKEISNLAAAYEGSDKQKYVNIVRVYPFKLMSEDNFYIIMEYCYQSTLEELIETRKRKKKKFNFGEFLVILQNLLSGYGLLYQNNIIHNDLKPQNIFIKDKIFKIGDFGLSKALTSSQDIKITQGTRIYSSLQKLRGQRTNHTADIYALGLILSEILFGRHPLFDKESWQKFYEKKKEEIQNSEYQIQILVPTEEQKLMLCKKQKQRELQIFMEYTKQRMEKPVEFNIAIDYNAGDKQMVDTIRQLVIDMWKSNERPTFGFVKDRILKLPRPLHSVFIHYPKFDDIDDLRASQLNFQIENLPFGRVSYMQKNKITKVSTQDMAKYQTIAKGESIKEKLFLCTKFIQQFQEATKEIKPEENHCQINTRILYAFKVDLWTYMYWFNKTELLSASEELKHLKFHQLNEVSRQGIQKEMRESMKKDQYLSELAFFEYKGNYLNEYRQELHTFFRNLVLAPLSKTNYLDYYWLLTLKDLLAAETDYSKDKDTSKFRQILIKIEQRVKMVNDEKVKWQQLFKVFSNEKWYSQQKTCLIFDVTEQSQ